MFAPRNSSPPLCGSDEIAAYQIKLKKVLGLTVCSNAALDASSVNGLLAYPAGCTVVLFNAKKHSQSYLINTSRKAITAVTFSSCGKYIATGESGINPAIKVWELDLSGNSDSNAGGTVVAEFLGHKNVVSCLSFSPSGKYLVSVGSQNDMIVNVFDWKLSLKIASNKVSAKVSAVSFSEDGSYFVTVGNRHVKYWYLKGNGKYKEPLPLMGRSAILGDHHDNDFSAVACGKADFSDRTFAITRVGHLVEFNSRRLLDKWVACRTNQASCISVTQQYILVGCAEAIIRIFHPITLEYITTLPRTHYLGVDVANGLHINHIMTTPPNARYPDTVAMTYDESRSKVTCVYNDHSMYIWDLRDIKRVGKSNSFLYHSTCIWGVESVPYSVNRQLNDSVSKYFLPEDCFLTCSSDDTIRVWGLDECQSNENYRKNIYSKNLLKVIYIDQDLSFIKDVDSMNLGANSEKNGSYDGRNGVRCIKINSDLNHVACGDRSGNIRIFDLLTVKLLTTIEAHDLEVLCLEYTNDKIERKLLASASRDRLIHVFDASDGYQILQTLDDHSSSITSIKFVGSGLNFQMISCGVDKSIMFRQYQNNQFLRGMHCSSKSTLYDMEVDSNSKHIMTACQDRNIRVYSTQNAKHTKTFKGSLSDDGSLVKLSLDPSGIYLATSCTDKTISVFDCYSNECMARMYGHSELVTGLRFTNDCKHLISSSGDGCVFIWQVPHDMIVTMQARLSQQRLRSGQVTLPRPMNPPLPKIIPGTPTKEPITVVFNDEVALTPGYKFSDVGQLPQWAKRKNEEAQHSSPVTNATSMGNLSSSPSQSSLVLGTTNRARGRWAQRGQIETDVMDLRSNSESPLGGHTTSSTIQTSDYNSASSKDIIYNQTYLSEDSSIDSGMETRREMNFAVGGNVTNPSLNIDGLLPEKKKLTFETNNDHDGDVEDMSDGERTSSDHGGYFPAISPGTPTEFKVNAMDEAELRKSIKRQKLEKSGLSLRASSAVETGTGTSDTEDDASTPSAENADHSLESALGGSMESISIQPDSSSFLQTALDGPSGFPDRGNKNRRSISAKHNTENNRSPSIPKSYTSTKKEELIKVINEAKQKLENVGYRSNLRGSQSISDLSNNTTPTDNSRFSRYSKPGNPKSMIPLSTSEESTIRRAISLSDLHIVNQKSTPKTPSSHQKPTPQHRSNIQNRISNKRNQSQGAKSNSGGMGSRSISVGVLNDPNSDSETESGNGRSRLGMSGKSNGSNNNTPRSKNVNNNQTRRKPGLNPSSSGNPQEDSSSEDTSNVISTSKPAVPPRPRSLSSDQRKLIGSSPNAKARGTLDFQTGDSNENNDLTQIINMLNTTTNAVLQFHSKLKSEEQSASSANNNNLMLKELENAVIMFQNMLMNVTSNKNEKSSLQGTSGSYGTQSTSSGTVSSSNPFLTSEQLAHLENGDSILMMNKCTDLLNKVRSKHKIDDSEHKF